ncbi:TIM barrel protein [Agrococcus beijingensis]|uniref:TIM barrel protein n=1 Tax=Agrococcus beijingensis TaxID=3068634 RepID=UPI0027414748|nr:TIM barrel protein [Agrococcus sp. REN33]
MKPAVNLSTVFRGLERDARPAAAAAAGFTRVESWWEFSSATPAPEDVARFVDALRAAGLELVAINAHGGDREAGERGMAALPDREQEFDQSIEAVAEVHRQLGPRLFNVTFGNLRSDRWTRDEQLASAAERYAAACERVATFGGTLLIEPLTRDGNPDYPMRTAQDAADFLDAFLPDVPNIGVLFDTFHLAANGVELERAIDELGPRIRHVQFADFPGRGRPGTGAIDFDALEERLDRVGYTGEISLEYLG